jgi:hypothetical protein
MKGFASGESQHDDHRIHSGSRGRRVDWRRSRKSLTTSLLDINVALTDIVFRRQDGLGARRPSSDYAIEGFVRSADADDDGASGPFLVYLSGYETTDRMDRDEDFDQRSVCYIATDRRPDFAWRTNIYIERFIFRRLVELYASKRIDSARISILLKVYRDPSGAIDVPHLSHSMLRTSGNEHRQHSRAHLMSVQTALGGPTQVHPALVAQSEPWGSRLGRRQDLAVQG